MSTNIIALKDIDKVYGHGNTAFRALKKVSFDINEHELVAIMGASGSGKSTLLNILGLLDKATAGSYHLKGTEVSELSEDEQAVFRNRHIGFVFQSFFLLPRFTALQNIVMPLSYRGMEKAEAEEAGMTMLARMGIERLAHSRPNEMSGGQQQRVAISRALVGNPDIILADEPTGALDTHTSSDVMALLLELNQKDGKTIVVVTHDPDVGKACQRTIELHDGEVVNEK